MQKPIRFIDLFAGIGGFRQVLEQQGATCVFSSEIDRHARQVYQQNFGEAPEGDLTLIPESRIPAHEILCAGFPCQAFSISGRQRGFLDTRGTLFFDMLRIAAHHQPQVIFLENVKNLSRHDNGKTMHIIRKSLSEIGYTVHDKILNASHFGLPQNRERLYIAAFRSPPLEVPFTFPKNQNTSIALQDILVPEKEAAPYVIGRTDIHIQPQRLQALALASRFPLAPIRIGSVGAGRQGERIYAKQGHAITLSAHGGGIGAKTGLYLIDEKVRKLTPRECARLQGFPDTFLLHSSDYQSYKQLGNSLPLRVVEAVFQQIKAYAFAG